MKNNRFSIKNFIIIILFAIFGINFFFLLPLEPFDELWNFQNCYKISNGFAMYSDANIIITPIFYYISLIFFKFFGATFLTFKFYNIFIYSIYFFLFYYLLKTLKISKHFIFLILSITLVQIHGVINGGANYNALAMAFILLGLITYLKLFEKKYFHYLQGFIIFLVFFTKQNLGVYYALGIIIFELIYKKNILNFIINQFKKFIFFLIPLLLSLLVFYLNGNLLDFLNYAFGGLFDFGKTNLGIALELYVAALCLFIIIVYFIIIFNKKIPLTFENKKNLTLFACVAITCTFFVFPIFNTAHFLYIIPFYFLILFYFLDFAILEDCFNTPKTISYLYIISFLSLIIMIARGVTLYISESKNYTLINDSNSPFYNVHISNENYEKMNTMTEYIKQKNESNKNVIIIAYDSALTTVPLKQNNQAFDLVFNGNLGYDGENKLIEKIKSSKNTEFLIFTNEEDCFWQESKTVRNFIVENLEKTGEILNYSIYELPNE